MATWIERNILSTIIETTQMNDRSTVVFYITSGGGEGKTVLLRQVGMKLGSKDGIQPNLPFSGILDLYHSIINTNSGLENYLSKALGTAGEFEEFKMEREIFTARRSSGLAGTELENERQRMAVVFANCVNKVSQWIRPVIAIDTTERIQYEVDEIQTMCDIRSESTTVREWLTTQLRLWNNCVVLLVGRPEKSPYLGQALKSALEGMKNVKYQEIHLGGFDDDESKRYFEEIKKDSSHPDLAEVLDPGFCKRLQDATLGSPIRLELALEVVRNGYEFQKFYQDVCNGSVDDIRKKIDHLLIQHVFMDEQDRNVMTAIRSLAAVRKGLDANLLLHLAGEGKQNDWSEALDKIKSRFYVKTHPQEDTLFLHDELYRFFDKHWLRSEEIQSWSQAITDWYDQRIEGANPEKAKDENEKQDLEKEKQELEIASLIYRLRANPIDGYHWYMRKAEFAIRGAEMGYDLRLRNELIAFFESDSEIDKELLRNAPTLIDEFKRDSAANWVKRLNNRGENEKAVRVYQTIENLGPTFYPHTQVSDLSKADLEVFSGQTYLYRGHIAKAVQLLQSAIDKLERGAKPEEIAQQPTEEATHKPITEYQQWRRNLILGRAHNNLGYANWMYLGHLHLALDEFQKALPYFDVSEISEELANTYDNMGRVHAMLRQQTRAESLVDEALRLRKKLGRKFRIALSLLSRGIVYLEFDEPHRSHRLCEQALQIFEDLKTRRGEGLARIVLARTLRELTRLRDELYTDEECRSMLTDAARYINEALGIFADVHEPIRVIEAVNELGCIYRERAMIAKEQQDALFNGLSSDAIRQLTKAADLAKEENQTVWYVDTSEDLAQVYLMRQDFANVTKWLDLAEKAIPGEYVVAKGETSQISEQEQIEIYWHLLGKIEMTRGDLLFEQEKGSGVVPVSREIVRKILRHYMLSVTYFDKFAERSPGLKDSFKHIYDHVKLLPFDERVYLAKQGLKEIADELQIDVDRFKEFYEDTIGITMHSK